MVRGDKTNDVMTIHFVLTTVTALNKPLTVTERFCMDSTSLSLDTPAAF